MTKFLDKYKKPLQYFEMKAGKLFFKKVFRFG